jgi:nodulation protein E
MANRVVITGLGVISAIGKSVPEFWHSIVSCQSGIAHIQQVDTNLLRFSNGAEVKNYQPLDHFSSAKELELLDPVAQFGIIAAREAVLDADIQWTEELQDQSCVITGCSIGGQSTQDKGHIDLYRENLTRLHPLTIPRIMPSAACSHIAMEFGVTGPAYTITTACSSSNHALGQAFWAIRNGVADLAITGGSEAPFSYLSLKAWEAIRVIAQDTCRPFSLDRPGMILGEGGAMLVLENLDKAKKRGAKIYAEIIGFGMSSDASHITRPHQRGAEKAMRMAMRDAGLDPRQVNYINAHGTGTAVNDAMETAAVKSVFQEHAGELAMSATKSMHGHALGASSAFEAISTTLALHHQVFPPTANYTQQDPECDLDIVPNKSREGKIEYALSNSFAFGGLNAVLAFKRWTGN